MSLEDLKEQVLKLSVSDRLSLMSVIVESLQEISSLTPDRSGAIRRMRGLLKIDQAAPTDEEVAVMLEERRAEKYL
jgi:hypothetical protein